MPQQAVVEFQPQPEPVNQSRIFYLVSHLAARRDRVLEDIIRPHGLTITQWRVLVGLGLLKSRTMNEVADFLALDRTTLTRTIDRLVERGLVVRAEVPHDRRLTEASLTAAGKALRLELLGQVVEVNERLTADVDSESLAIAEQVFELMLERLIGHRAGARRITDLV
mgnify:CR=1 FL=1|jgi:Transcriptional regulators